jgi:hypothetical protein
MDMGDEFKMEVFSGIKVTISKREISTDYGFMAASEGIECNRMIYIKQITSK